MVELQTYCFKHKSMKSRSLKKMSDGQSDIHITIRYIFFSTNYYSKSKKLMWDEIKVYIDVF